MPEAVLAQAGQLKSRRKLLLTRDESESRDGSWSLAALRMASQGETGKDTIASSLDVMGDRTQRRLSVCIINKESCGAHKVRWQCLGVQGKTSIDSLPKALSRIPFSTHFFLVLQTYVIW